MNELNKTTATTFKRHPVFNNKACAVSVFPQTQPDVQKPKLLDQLREAIRIENIPMRLVNGTGNGYFLKRKGGKIQKQQKKAATMSMKRFYKEQ